MGESLIRILGERYLNFASGNKPLTFQEPYAKTNELKASRKMQLRQRYTLVKHRSDTVLL